VLKCLRWLVDVLAGMAVVLAVVLPLVLPMRCPVNRAAADKIKPGMTQAEVEKALGGPPGDYRTKPGLPGVDGWSGLPFGRLETWSGDSGDVLVCFGEDGLVQRAVFLEVSRQEPSPAATAKWRLKRLEQRWLP
jgi:hypothetical protein